LLFLDSPAGGGAQLVLDLAGTGEAPGMQKATTAVLAGARRAVAAVAVGQNRLRCSFFGGAAWSR
jgi:hypothetical protein